MNHSSDHLATAGQAILLVPYMWIGDFVRCHSVVQLLNARFPGRPVDLLTTTLCAPLLHYMSGVRKGIVADLPRRRLAYAQHRALARRLSEEHYGTALVMPRTWKSALAPFLAGIPERIGFAGEARFGLINDIRWGERQLPRMIDVLGALALPKSGAPPADWPQPKLTVPPAELAQWLARRKLADARRPVVAFAPGAVGEGKAWPPTHYAEVAKRMSADGVSVWILGGPNERDIAQEISAGKSNVTDLTGHDLRDAILALAAADVALTNDSGLMHIAAALGTPTVAIFGPTDPALWAPLNPLAAVLEPPKGPCPGCGRLECREITHRRTADIDPARAYDTLRAMLGPITEKDRPHGSADER